MRGVVRGAVRGRVPELLRRVRKVTLVTEAAALGAEEGGAPLRLVQRVELRLPAELVVPLAVLLRVSVVVRVRASVTVRVRVKGEGEGAGEDEGWF